ncbi:MAG: hypothetical protein U0736_22300 [Gemmataceae bacterium]
MPAVFRAFLFTLASTAFVAPVSRGAAPPPAVGGLILVDAAGKEHQLRGYKFTAGTRRLGWLAAPGKPSSAPEALVVRDEMKFHFLAGVLTLVPLDRVRSIEFDADKTTMTVRVVTSAKPEEDVTLAGTTAYKGINKLAVEAEVDRGEAGVAEVTFQGGTLRGGIRAVRFPAPRPEAGAGGRPAVVVTADRDARRTFRVHDLQPLYQVRDGGERRSPLLLFRKTLRVDVARVAKITTTDDDGDDPVWRVIGKDGDDSSLTLLPSGTIDGAAATLVGLVGRVPAGYALFPVRRIREIHFDTTEPPAEEKPRDKDDRGDKGVR